MSGPMAFSGVRALSPEALRLLTMTPLARITNPDLGFQLSICVNPLAEQLIMMALRSLLTTPMAVGGRMIALVPPTTPLDTRVNCLDGERIGLWFPNAATAGRDEALRLPSRLMPGENYVQTISLNAIRFVADAIWNSPITPRRITLPDPFADARLTTFEITLVPPNRIVTRINGVVPIAVLPDVTFSVTFTDTLILDGAGQVQCMSATPQVNVQNALLRPILGNVLDLFGNVFLGGLAGRMASPGCRVLRLLAPGGITVPIPMCGRINFPYSRLDVDAAGVTLGSRAPLHPCLMAARVMEEPFRAPR